jgi:hypothetical protein
MRSRKNISLNAAIELQNVSASSGNSCFKSSWKLTGRRILKLFPWSSEVSDNCCNSSVRDMCVATMAMSSGGLHIQILSSDMAGKYSLYAVSRSLRCLLF